MDSDTLFGKVSATICDILAQHCSNCIEFDKEITIFGMISVAVDKSNNREPREYLLKVSRTVEKTAADSDHSSLSLRAPNSDLCEKPALNGTTEMTGQEARLDVFKSIPNLPFLPPASLMANFLAKTMPSETAGAHDFIPQFPFPPIDKLNCGSSLPPNVVENVSNMLAAAARNSSLPATNNVTDANSLASASRFMALEMLAAFEMRRAAQTSCGGTSHLDKLQRAAIQNADRISSGTSNSTQPNGLVWNTYDAASKLSDNLVSRAGLLTGQMLVEPHVPSIPSGTGAGAGMGLGLPGIDPGRQIGLQYPDFGCYPDESHAADKAAANNGQMKVITDLKQDRRALRHDPQTAEVFSWIRTMADTSDTACQICGKQFTNKWSLRRHLLQHTGYKPYLCILCNRSFYRRDHFSSHMIAWHKNDPNRCAATNSALGQAENVLCAADSHPFAIENLISGSFSSHTHETTDSASPDSAHHAQRLSPLSVTRTDSSDDSMRGIDNEADRERPCRNATSESELADAGGFVKLERNSPTHPAAV